MKCHRISRIGAVLVGLAAISAAGCSEGSGSGGGIVVAGGSTASGGAHENGGSTATSASGGASATGGTNVTGGATGTGGVTGSSGTTSAGGATRSGGATSTGGGTATGGATGTGGTRSTGGTSSGGSAAGGAATGGAGSGGRATGGNSSGGSATGGAATGGAGSGGRATGGNSSGGAASGGSATGGSAAGGSTGGPTVPRLTNGTSGVTTRYWDCCRPTCAWLANAQKSGMSSAATACAKDGVTKLPESAGTACGGGTAYQCSWGAPWSVSPTLSYGYAAFNGNTCGKCYQLDFSGKLAGKSMIVQALNTGGIAANQFDLLIPGGGVGANNACTGTASIDQWGNVSGGSTFGGFPSTCGSNMSCITTMCQTAFGGDAGLMAGCDWYTGWFAGTSNPSMVYAQVPCPADITNRSGLK